MFGEPSLVHVRVILLIDTDKTGDNLYSRTELGTLRIYTCMYAMGESTKRWALTLLKVDEPFGPWFHFKKKFGNQHLSM